MNILTKGSLGLLATCFLLVSCLQKKEHTALHFEEKEGQIAVSTEDYALNFVEDEVAIALPSGQTVATMNFETSTPALVNNKVVYEDIAQQADLIFYDKQNGNAGYDIRLQPRGNLNDIQLQLSDAEDAYITGDGQLAIPVEGGEIRHSKPYAYQEIDGEKIEVESRFALAEGILSFIVPSYNQDYELIIDPEIFFVAKEEQALMMEMPMMATGPGGVSSQVWLKADDGLMVDGSDNATNWMDNSGNSRDADIIVGDPQRLENVINFNPAIDFDGNDYFRFNSSPFVNSFTAAEAILVIKDDQYTACSCGGAYNFGGSGSNSHYSWSDQNIYDNAFTNDRIGFNPLTGAIVDGKPGVASITGDPVDVRNWNIYGTYGATNEWGVHFNGDIKAATTSNTPSFALSGANELVGAWATTGIFNGDIAEVLLFDKVLSTAERNQVDSYLGIKYGITLGHDYVASDGTSIWTIGSSYDNDITGIGQDDDSGLFQKQSKSINAGAMLSLAVGNLAATNADNTGTFSADKDFVVVGHDGGSLGRSTNVPAAYDERLQRIWQADVTGGSNGVQVCFDRSELTGFVADVSKIALLTSATTDFSGAS
ncbi:MAG: hypothetical protein AAF599_06995, partial [Bacteroidota bacterium]